MSRAHPVSFCQKFYNNSKVEAPLESHTDQAYQILNFKFGISKLVMLQQSLADIPTQMLINYPSTNAHQNQHGSNKCLKPKWAHENEMHSNPQNKP